VSGNEVTNRYLKVTRDEVGEFIVGSTVTYGGHDDCRHQAGTCPHERTFSGYPVHVWQGDRFDGSGEMMTFVSYILINDEHPEVGEHGDLVAIPVESIIKTVTYKVGARKGDQS